MGIARFPDGSPVQVIFPQCEILNTLETRVVELAPIGNPFDLKNSQLGYWEQLDNTKRQIDDVSNALFKAACRRENKYELIQKICALPDTSSRAFFKLYDIIFSEPYIKDTIFKSIKKPYVAFLAEGPGGFIDAIKTIRYNKKRNYHYPWNWKAITLKPGPGVPAEEFNTKFLKNFGSHIIYGPHANSSGNINVKENIEYFCKIVKQDTQGRGANLITADGGFNVADENLQEVGTSQLMFSQTVAALNCQAKGGVFILKIFDTFTDIMAKLIFMMTCLYTTVKITKPEDSRICNSEKYLICIDFKGASTQFLDYLYDMVDSWDKNPGYYPILPLKPSTPFVHSLKQFNNKYVMIQIEKINSALEFVKGADNFDKQLYTNAYINRGSTQFIYVNWQSFREQIILAKQWLRTHYLPIKKQFNNLPLSDPIHQWESGTTPPGLEAFIEPLSALPKQTLTQCIYSKNS